MNELSLKTDVDLQVMQSEEFVEKYQALKNEIDRLKELKESLDEKMLKAFEEVALPVGFKSFESLGGRLKVTYTPAGTTKRFDSTNFKQEQPEMYEAYVKETPTKAKLTITIREKENEC